MLDPPQLILAVFINFQMKRTPYRLTKQLNLTHPNQLCSQHAGGEIGKKGNTGKQQPLTLHPTEVSHHLTQMRIVKQGDPH